MALGPRLEVNQTQRLNLTPQLRQAISLLQMTNVELADYLAEEAEKNPILELVEPEPSTDDFATAPEATPHNDTESLAQTPRMAQSSVMENFDPFEYIEDERSLRDLLREQIHISDRNQARASIALVLIDELDEQGWLTSPLFELTERLGVSQAAIEEALEALQACDPIGIGARNLQECLEIQLKDSGNLTPLMKVLTSNLEVLANNDLPKLEEIAGVSREEIEDAVRELRQLNPRPAADFDNEIMQIAIADVAVSRSAVGGWSVELNTDALPKALVNENTSARLLKTVLVHRNL